MCLEVLSLKENKQMIQSRIEYNSQCGSLPYTVDSFAMRLTEKSKRDWKSPKSGAQVYIYTQLRQR